MNDTDQKPLQCSECQTGVMRLRHLTYFTWLNEELVTVPNFPAWVCDLCGRREYDSHAISWLVAILNPETGKTSNAKRWPPPPPEKRDGPRPIPE